MIYVALALATVLVVGGALSDFGDDGQPPP